MFENMSKLSDAKKKAEENPNDPDIQTEYAEELIQNSQYSTAASVAEKALKLDTKHVRAHSIVALNCMIQNNLGEAKSILEKAMSIDDQSDIVWIRMGLVHMFSKQFMDAINSFIRVIELRPDFKGLSNLGWCYHYIGDYENAMKYGEKQVELEPDNMFGLKLVLQTCLVTGKTKKGIDYFIKIIKLGTSRIDIFDMVAYYFRRLDISREEFNYLLGQLKSVDVKVKYRNTLLRYFSIIFEYLTKFSFSIVLLETIENHNDLVELELDILRLEWLKNKDFEKTHNQIQNITIIINSEFEAHQITETQYFDYAKTILSLYIQIQSRKAVNAGIEFYDFLSKYIVKNINLDPLYILIGDLYKSINDFNRAKEWYEKVPDVSQISKVAVSKTREMINSIREVENYIKDQLYFAGNDIDKINEIMTPELLSIERDQKLSETLFRYPVDEKEKILEFLEFCLVKMTEYYDNVVHDGTHDGEVRWVMRHRTYRSMANVLRYFHDDVVERLLDVYFDPPKTIKAWKIVEIIIYLISRDHANYFNDTFNIALNNSKENDYFRILAKHGNERSLDLVFDFLKTKLDNSEISQDNPQVPAMNALIELSNHFNRVNESTYLDLIGSLVNDSSYGEKTRIKAIEFIRNNNLIRFTDTLIELTNEKPPKKDNFAVWAEASMNHGYVNTIPLAAQETLASFGIDEYINQFFELMIQENAPSSLFNSINNICKNDDGFSLFESKFIEKVREVNDQNVRENVMKYVSYHLSWSRWGYEETHGRNHFRLYVGILNSLRPYTTLEDTGFIALGINLTRANLEDYPDLLWSYDDYLLSYLNALNGLEFESEVRYKERLKPINEKLVTIS